MDQQKTYPVAPEGEQRVVCVDVEYLGKKRIQYKGRPAKMLERVALFFLSEHRNSEGKMISIREEFTLSFYESARLRRFVDRWRGERRPDSFYTGFDADRLIGANALVVISHNVTPDRIYANIDNVRPYRGTEPLRVPADFIRKKDRVKQPESAAPVLDAGEVPF